ncbi:hypothetical protein EON63_11245 [archaeon]|nr:MAG: hypothetical protein EON63_11245 [archaeon]
MMCVWYGYGYVCRNIVYMCVHHFLKHIIFIHLHTINHISILLVTRDRMGRLVTFMSRILKDATVNVPTQIRGLGVDEHTALLLDTVTG